MKKRVNKMLAVFLTLSLLISVVPSVPVFAWNTTTTAPAVLTDPDYMYPAFSNGQALLDKKQGRLPALGWNSWNAFGSNNTEVLAKAMADKFIELGLDKVGYEYIVLDDGCYENNRVDGKLTNNVSRFPSGFNALSDYIHGLGLKFGMYNDVGIALCAGAQVGTNGFEDTDCATYKEWGVDYLKVDNCAFRWDVAYPGNTRYATQGMYPFTPKIRSITVTGGSLNQTLNAISDGELKGNGGYKDTSGDCVYGIGILSGKQPGNDPTAINWSELEFKVNVPSDGVYSLTVNYASNGSDLGTNVEKNSSPGIGRWLQVAVGPMENEKRFFDNLLPATSDMTTFVDSDAIQIELKAGENTVRLMNRRRGENALQAYAAFRDSLDRCGNPDTILSLCEWGLNQPQEWAYKVGNSWRILDDIGARWVESSNSNGIMAQYNKAVIMDEFAGLDKGWNDPDMMEIGNGNVTTIQSKTHMTMWCMMNSPIMLGNDLRKVNKGDDIWKIIANGDVIDFNQDPLGIQSKRIYCSVSDNPTSYVTNNSRIDVLAKPLANGDVALSFINVGTGVRTASVDVNDIISYIGGKMADGNGGVFENAEAYLVYDVWGKEFTLNTTGVFTPPRDINAYDNYTIRITPVPDQGQAMLNKLSDGNYTATFAVKSGSCEKAFLCLAEYDSNKALSNIITKVVNVDAPAALETLTTNEPPKSKEVLKVFMWDAETFKPLIANLTHYVPLADKSSLQLALKKAEEITDLSIYIRAGVDAFLSALESAKAIDQEDNPSQASIDSAASALTEAMAQLARPKTVLYDYEAGGNTGRFNINVGYSTSSTTNILDPTNPSNRVLQYKWAATGNLIDPLTLYLGNQLGTSVYPRKLSAKVYLVNDENAAGSFELYGKMDNVNRSGEPTTVKGEWVEIYSEVIAPGQNLTEIGFMIRGLNTSTLIYIDDITLSILE